MDRQEREAKIDQLCDEAGCSDKIRKIHFEQFVHRSWHPHPPQKFLDWWEKHPESEINPKVAYNCTVFRNEFIEAKSYGVA